MRGRYRARTLRVLAATGAVACAAPGRSGDEATLRFWAFGREGEVVAAMVRDFGREHPGIRVQVQAIPWTAAHEKLLTAHVGRASPDIAQLGNTWVPEFAALGALEPLNGRLAGHGAPPPASYPPGVWATNVIGDTVYGVPWYVDTRVLFYRSDLLRAAGYDRMPEDWAGWRRAMAAIARRGGPRHWAIVIPVPPEWPPLAILGLQAGSPLVTADGHGAFADSAFAAAFDWLLGLFDDGLAPRFSSIEIANLYQEFARGTFAMYISGPWNLGEFRRRLPPELAGRWSTAPLPGPTGAASGVSLAGGASLVVFRRSRHQEAAWRLLEFLSRPEQQARFYHLTGNLPAREEAWSDTALARDREVQAFRTQLARVVPTPMIPEWEQVTVLAMDHAERAIRGRQSAPEALRALDHDVDRLLERRRWLLARAAAQGAAR